jgi:hypothetical protein
VGGCRRAVDRVYASLLVATCIEVQSQKLAPRRHTVLIHSEKQALVGRRRAMPNWSACRRRTLRRTARSSLRLPSARRVAPAGAGLFDRVRRLGRCPGDTDGLDARAFHAAELNAVFVRWTGRATINNEEAMFTEISPPPTEAADCPDPRQSQRPQSMSGAAAIRNSERPRCPRNLHRGEGIRVHRRVPAAGPPARLHRYEQYGHDPLSLLHDAVPVRSSIDTAKCRPAGQLLYRP